MTIYRSLLQRDEYSWCARMRVLVNVCVVGCVYSRSLPRSFLVLQSVVAVFLLSCLPLSSFS